MISVKSGGFTLLFEVNNDCGEAFLTGYEGSDATLFVPMSINDGSRDFNVTVVERKAFLGCKGLREVTLPETVRMLSDWCFAQCIHLNSISFSLNRAHVEVAKNAFEGCEKIESINLGNGDSDLSKLLAAVVGKLPAAYLLSDADVGSIEWYKRWDLSLKAFLDRDDYEGYSDRALCGEEDISYDGIGSIDGEMPGESAAYLKEVGKNKSGLAYLRLLNPRYLDEATKNMYETYIKEHAKGSGNQASWLYVREDGRENTEFLKLYIDIVKPDASMLDDMLLDLGDEMAQAKAYIIKIAKKDNKTDDFFGALTL